MKKKHSTFSVAKILANNGETLFEHWGHHFGHLSHKSSVARAQTVLKVAELVVEQTKQCFDSIKHKKRYGQKLIHGKLHQVTYSGHTKSKSRLPTITYEDICSIAKSCGWSPKSSASISHPLALKSIQGLLRSLEKMGVLSMANANQYAKKGCEKYPWLRADHTIAFYVDLGPKVLPTDSIPLKKKHPKKDSPINQSHSQDAINTTLSDSDRYDWNVRLPPSSKPPLKSPSLSSEPEQ